MAITQWIRGLKLTVLADHLDRLTFNNFWKQLQSWFVCSVWSVWKFRDKSLLSSPLFCVSLLPWAHSFSHSRCYFQDVCTDFQMMIASLYYIWIQNFGYSLGYTSLHLFLMTLTVFIQISILRTLATGWMYRQVYTLIIWTIFSNYDTFTLLFETMKKNWHKKTAL